MLNWSLLLNSEANQRWFVRFVEGDLSFSELDSKILAHTCDSRFLAVRLELNKLHNYGYTRARRLAVKSLRRRGYEFNYERPHRVGGVYHSV